MEQVKLLIKDISKAYNTNVLASHLDMTLDSGIHVITGENGCGKTSLLKMMMGLTLPDSGNILLFGEDTQIFSNAVKSKIGFVFASDRSLYYKLTASENLKYIGSIYGLKKKELEMLVPQLLNLVNLNEEGKFIETFSTGMKKRLMLAKAIMHNPDILFLDEIYSGLDKEGCKIVSEILEKLSLDNKLIILVTHQQDCIPENSILYELREGKLHVLDR